MIHGILAIDKPLGWTSHDVVARCRRVAGQRQVGHAGTLDPLATGVLLLVLGSATRLSSYLMETRKVYCADVVLGATTATDDAEAPLQTQADASHITLDDLHGCLARFTGDLEQVPPAYAAVRRGGQKMYVLARQGIEVERPPRPVTIDQIELVEWKPPRVRLLVRCGPGTYIRSLARDVGAALGVGGYLHGLRRIRSGQVGIDDCHALDSLTDRAAVEAALLPPDYALLHLPAAVLSPAEVAAVRTGQAVPGGRGGNEEVRLYDPSGTLVGLARQAGGLLKPFRVFQEGMTADAGRD